MDFGSCVFYYTNKIADESSTDYISSATHSYIANNKCLKNVLIWCDRCKRAKLSRKIFLSFTIDGCSFIKLYCYECVICINTSWRWHFKPSFQGGTHAQISTSWSTLCILPKYKGVNIRLDKPWSANCACLCPNANAYAYVASENKALHVGFVHVSCKQVKPCRFRYGYPRDG